MSVFTSSNDKPPNRAIDMVCYYIIMKGFDVCFVFVFCCLCVCYGLFWLHVISNIIICSNNIVVMA